MGEHADGDLVHEQRQLGAQLDLVEPVFAAEPVVGAGGTPAGVLSVLERAPAALLLI